MAIVVKSDCLAVPAGKPSVTVGNRSGLVLIADAIVALTGKRSTQDLELGDPLVTLPPFSSLLYLRTGISCSRY
jgi:hypothetical protein